MFGINVGQVVRGHINEITKQEQELSEQRMKICKQCPLFTDSMGGICDSKKCLNIETGKLQSYPSNGYTCGCACRLNAKTRLRNAKCVLNKW
jgi:hypothetical protein